MSENSVTRARLVKVLAPLNAIPVENRVRAGTPDVNFCGGWIECKKLSEWPKKPETVVKLSHPLLKTQEMWIKARCAVNSYELILVCLHAKREWLFFNGLVACRVLGRATRVGLYSEACLVMDRLNGDLLIRWIRANLENLRKEKDF